MTSLGRVLHTIGAAQRTESRLLRLHVPPPSDGQGKQRRFELFVRDYFRKGRAAEISGHQGVALQVRPKARNAADLRSAVGA